MFNPHSNDWLNNKFDYYKELRKAESAFYSKKYKLYVITRHNDIDLALNSPEVYSSAKGNLIVENPNRFGRTLGASDNPTHNIFKNIVKEAYSKSNLNRIMGALSHAIDIEFTANTLNVSLASKRISAYVVAEILNLPCSKSLVQDIILDIQNTALHAIANSNSREAHDRLTTLVNSLITNKVEPLGPGIYAEYIKANNPKVMSLFTGPTISGVSSLIGALQFLTLDLYRTNNINNLINNTLLIPNAVNESLRYNASTGRFSRTVAKNTRLHNVDLKPGDRIALCLESGNRDESVFTNADSFLLTRDTSKSLGFGRGIHSCIALAISKRCMEVYLAKLLNVYKNYKVVPVDKLDFIMTASGNDDMINNLVIEG